MNSKEKQIIMLAANGYEIEEIAQITLLSTKSVDNYQKKIMNKLNAKNMPEAVNSFKSIFKYSS